LFNLFFQLSKGSEPLESFAIDLVCKIQEITVKEMPSEGFFGKINQPSKRFKRLEG